MGARRAGDLPRGSRATRSTAPLGVPRARLAVGLTPRAGIDSLDRPGADGVAHARVRAAPVDGAANEALLRLVAARLGVPRSAVALVAGARARRKLIEIEGLDGAEVERRLRSVADPG